MSALRSATTMDTGEPGTIRPAVTRILVFAFLGTLFDGAELNLVGYPLDRKSVV